MNSADLTPASADEAPPAEKDTFPTLAARYALAGWQLWRSDPGDGHQRFFAGRWARLHVMADLAEVERFLHVIAGGKAG